jgi:hypothetical protein
MAAVSSRLVSALLSYSHEGIQSILEAANNLLLSIRRLFCSLIDFIAASEVAEAHPACLWNQLKEEVTSGACRTTLERGFANLLHRL